MILTENPVRLASYIPQIHTEETVFSYAIRGAATTNYFRRRSFLQHAFGRSYIPNSAPEQDATISCLESMLVESGHTFRRSAFSEHALTVIAAFVRPPEQIPYVWSENTSSVIPNRHGSDGMPHTKFKRHPSFCIECAKSDLDLHGYT